jgi:RHS repeat-associated protein
MTSPLRIRYLCAFALSLIGSLFIAVGNLRTAFSLMRTWFARWRRASLHPARARHARSGFRRFACLVMAGVMFLQVPASPHVSHAVVERVSAKAVNSWESGRFWWHSSGWAARYERLRNEYLPNIGATPQKRGWDGKGAPRHSRPAPQAVETQRDGEQKIARIRIFPGDVEIKTGEQIVFNAVAFDQDGNAVGGLDVKWDAFDEEKNQPLTISSQGTFVFGAPGKFIVTAEIAGRKEHVKVTVSGEPRSPNVKSRSETPKSSRESRRVGSLRAPTSSDRKLIARRSKQGRTPALADLRAASAPMAALPVMQIQGEDYTGWNSLNNDTADDVGRERGHVPGRAVDGGAGSANFQFAGPAVVMDGRGIDLSLLLSYNSRLWHKAGSELTFDIDRDTLVPGWNLGFGKIVMAGDSYMLIDGDGTRHSYEGTLRRDFSPPANSLQTFEAHTADGTFIDYYAEGYKPEHDNSGGRNMIMAWAVMPNGTRIEYGAPANYAMYPTRITDAHGNFISITYRNNQGPQIQTITDTLGRFVQFYYDVSGLLTAITVPGLGGGSRVVVRLQYQWLTLSNAGANYGFTGVTTKVRQNTIPVVRAIYYPGTGNGYWFGDGDSYSLYGMIRKVSARRGMTIDNAPLDQQGNIGAGVMSREMIYNYPQSGGSYSDMPTYTQMTEDWAARETPAAPVTYFSVVNSSGGSTRTTTITRPDGAQLKQITDNNQSSTTYGMLLEDALIQGAATLSRSTTFWAIGDYNSPRPTQIRTYDERGQSTATVYAYNANYGSRYNSVTGVFEYGYNNELLRHTHTEYLNNSNYNGALQNSGMLWWKPTGAMSGGPTWSGSHIFDLISLTEVYAGDDVTRLSRAEYQYDGGDLINNTGMWQHNNTYNQHAPEYDPATLYRGNITQVKRYADALTPDQGTAVVESRNYDIAGNVRARTTPCCDQTSFGYTAYTQYAWPESATSGSPSDPAKQNTASATYDYYTGLVNTSTDANGRISQTFYDPNTLRPVYKYSPTGAYQYHIYDDPNLVVIDIVYEAGQSGGNFASRSDKYVDGLGRVHGEVTYGKDYVLDVFATKFDNLGRVWQQTRPYRYGVETPQWSTVVYDSLDRPIQTTSPDGSIVTRAYNQSPDPPAASGQPGQTVKVTDPWGRERWARSDALGRMAEVAEPNPGGNGSLSGGVMYSTYSYDALNRLLLVSQGLQTRRFRYDSLGRLTHQKLAERDATLNDGGQWVGAGVWSDVFFYDTRSNVTLKVDARGVRTGFNYNDPLNRLLAVNYDKSGSPAHLSVNIPSAPNVSYSYMNNGNRNRVENVFVDFGMGNEQFSYDSEGRLSQVRQTFTGRESYPLVTSYMWDSLDRLKESAYPQQYGAGEIRKKVEPAYDIASRIESLKFGGETYASNPVFNAVSQTTSLNVGGQIAESYSYDPKTGLMTNQQVRQGSDLLVDLKYNYTLNNDPNNNGAKTGQLTSLTDLKNQARNRAYEYDKLGRLIKAKGGANAISGPDWEQIYNYDRYGNRGMTGSGGGSAPVTEVWVDDAPPAGAVVNSYVKPSASIALRSINGYYVVEDRVESIDVNPDFRGVNANRTGIGPWETFDLIDINEGSLESGDQIQLRTYWQTSPRYVNAGPRYPGNRLYTLWGDYPPITTFKIRKVDGSPGIIDNDTDISLQSTFDDKYVVAESGGAPQGSPPPQGQMLANRTAVGPWETFRLIVVSGSTREGSDERWEWTSNPIPNSGAQSHRSKGRPGLHQHYFWGATQTLQVNAGDKLFAYVYLDPGSLPSEIMLQWNENGSWEHRAYWGANNIFWGTDVTESRRYMGPLPQAGGWVKLEVPASAVGLEGKTLNGMAFTLCDGQAWWDKAGKTSAGGPPNPVTGRDGFDNLTYDAASNRIISPGFDYDPAGNQTRAVIDNIGTQQQFRYDCANRLAQVADAYGTVLATYSYGAGNQRLMSVEGGVTRYFAWNGGKIIAEYEAWGSNGLVWKTSYVYLGGQLLATTSGAGGTETRFHHPDRLGTRLTTDAGGTVVSEQWTMPFGNMQPFTSIPGGENPYQHPTLGNPSKKRFTSYDRSDATGLDYAVNRFYIPQQGRFTQVDPIGMGSAELANPQSLNLYSYVENDPINSTDPLGLDGVVNSLSWSGPIPTGGGGGGGGLRIGPFSFSFSFGGWSFFNFGSLQQSKKEQPKRPPNFIGVIVVTPNGTEPSGPGGPGGIGGPGSGGVGGTGPGGSGGPGGLGGSSLSDDEILDTIQQTLDIAGMVPGFGEAADFTNAVISFGRRDYTGVVLSLAAMIPVVGILATYAKRLRRIARLGARRIIAGTDGLTHSFDSHAGEWFGRQVRARTDMGRWQALIERATASRKRVPWNLRGTPTVGHLARIDGKYFFAQFYVEGPLAGELATAFVPDQSQLSRILRLLK